MLMVFASHIPQAISIPNSIGSLLAPMGYHGVAIFLFLSGYGCYISLEKNTCIGKFVANRLKNILPPFIMLTVVASIIGCIANDTTYSLIEIALNSVGLSHSILQLTWYILFQYICYIAICVAVKFFKREYRAVAMMFFALITYVFSVTIHIANLWGLNFASFFIGVCVALYRKKIQSFVCTHTKVTLTMFTITLSVLWLGLFYLTYFVLHNPSDVVLRNLLKESIAAVFILALCSFTTSHISFKIELLDDLKGFHMNCIYVMVYSFLLLQQYCAIIYLWWFQL